MIRPKNYFQLLKN